MCRTTGVGGGNCQGYRIVLNFNVGPTYSWNITITEAQIVNSNGATLDIKEPAAFPVVISAASPTIPLWFCTSKSGDHLDLQISYTISRTDLPSIVTTGAFPQQSYSAIPVC